MPLRFWTFVLGLLIVNGSAFAAEPLETAKLIAASAADTANLASRAAIQAAVDAGVLAERANAAAKLAPSDKRIAAANKAAEVKTEAVKAVNAANEAVKQAATAKQESDNAGIQTDPVLAKDLADKAAKAAVAAATNAITADDAKKAAEEALKKTFEAAGIQTTSLETNSKAKLVAINPSAPATLIVPPGTTLVTASPTPPAPVVIVFNKPILLYPPNLPLNCVPSPHLAVAQIAPGLKLTLKDQGQFDVDGVVLTNGQTVHLRLGFELVVEGGANCPLKSIYLVVEPMTLAANGGTAAGPNRSFSLATAPGNAIVKALPNPVLDSQLTSGCLKQALAGHSGPIIIDNSLPLTACAAQTQSKLRVVRHISATTGA